MVIAVIFITAIAPAFNLFAEWRDLPKMVGILGIVTVLGNVSAELVTRFRQGERISKRVQFLVALVITYGGLPPDWILKARPSRSLGLA